MELCGTVRDRNVVRVRELMDAGADVNAKLNDGYTALGFTADYGQWFY